jgi:hypothetical protein
VRPAQTINDVISKHKELEQIESEKVARRLWVDFADLNRITRTITDNLLYSTVGKYITFGKPSPRHSTDQLTTTVPYNTRVYPRPRMKRGWEAGLYTWLTPTFFFFFTKKLAKGC